MNIVKVNRKAAGRVASGHPWIFSSDIVDRDGAQPGEAVKVCDERGRPLWSYAQPSGHSDAGPLERRLSQLDAYALRSLGIPERALTQDAATGRSRFSTGA